MPEIAIGNGDLDMLGWVAEADPEAGIEVDVAMVVALVTRRAKETRYRTV